MLRQIRGALDDFREALRSPTPPADEPDLEGGDERGDGEAAGGAALVPPTASAETLTRDAIDTPSTRELASVETEAPTAAPPRPQRRWAPVVMATTTALAIVLGAGLLLWAPWNLREPADPAVVATFQGGTVTRDQLVRQFQSLPREQQPRYRSSNGLRALIGDTVMHDVTRRWAEEKQVDQRETFKDAMKHATEQIQLADVSDQLHEGRIQVGEGEIQAYYDQNRQRFGDRPLVEVRELIRRLVVEEKEQAFVQNYVKELRERSSLQVDYSLLDVPEPTEQELVASYQSNRDAYRVPEQARIAQIQVSVSLSGGDDKARAKAESTRARAAAGPAGEDFTQLHHELSDSSDRAVGGELPAPVARGSRTPAFDEAVFVLPVGAISAAFREGDSYYIVKVLQRWPEQARPYEEVRAEIADALRAQREQQVYAERKDRTLFTIHSRRTTLGEFTQELSELPPQERSQYPGIEGKRKLLDQLIERLLVVEDASEQAADVNRKEEVEHARADLLGRLLHQEQVDEQAQVTDEEVRAEYDRNRARYADPPKVKVRYIRVGRGQNRDTDEKARAKITEAESMVRPGGWLGGGGDPSRFAEVAQQYSEDPASAARGGELDRWLGESTSPFDEMVEHALHEVILPLQVGDLSPVTPLGDSYFLFQILEKQEARQRSFEEAGSDIRRQLEARKHEELTSSMERQLVERMQLQIYDRRVQAVLVELGGPAAGTR